MLTGGLKMKINPLFKKYLKISIIIPIIYFIIFSFVTISINNSAKDTLNYVNDNLDNLINSKEPLEIKNNNINIGYYLYFTDENDNNISNSILSVFENLYLNINRSVIIPIIFYFGIGKDNLLFFELIIFIYVMILYKDEKNKKTSHFISSLPIKRESLYLYRIISGILMISLLFILPYILYYFTMLKNESIILEISKNPRVGNEIIKLFKTEILLNPLKDTICMYSFCLLGFSIINLSSTLFGKQSFSLFVSFSAFFAVYELIVGIDKFLRYYLKLQPKFFNRFSYYTFHRLYQKPYLLIFISLILITVGFLFYRKSDCSNYNKLFIFKPLKYIIYASVFICGGFTFLSVLHMLDLINGGSVLTGIIIIVSGCIISTLILKKYEQVNM